MGYQESENKKKKLMGIGIIALILSIVGTLMVASTAISFISVGVLGLNLSIIYISLALNVVAIILGLIVENLEHSDEKLGSVAKTMSEWSIAAIVAIYAIIKFN